ncbi:hypothetical protein [Isoptericola croceus]|uniref:hypothetical protein n=1 Tax=Isoptericola croceus TaxID=3031406 RepID=UPI0023F8C2A2|nr:hypothetical protein [Isoptericola croceus]
MTPTTSRIAHFAEPGTGLLLCSSIFDLDDHAESFAGESGLGHDGILVSAVANTPVPDYVGRAGDSLRWPEAEAAFMWHPLMWLPDDLVRRRRVFAEVDDSEPAEVAESDEMLAVRLALVCSATGLYDPADGTWLDVLSTVGLDRTDPTDLARVRSWLDGGPDPSLDQIDFTDLTDRCEQLCDTARDITSAVEDAAVALAAREAVTALAEFFGPGVSTDDRAQHVSVLTLLAILGDLLPEWLVDDAAALGEAAAGAQDAPSAADMASRWLNGLADRYDPTIEVLQDMFEVPARIGEGACSPPR